MRLPQIPRKAGALMLCIGDVGPSDLLKEVDLSHDVTIVEALFERRGGSVAAPNLRGQSGSLARRGVHRKLDTVDNDVNYLSLGHIDIYVVLLLGVDTQVILNVALVFDV